MQGERIRKELRIVLLHKGRITRVLRPAEQRDICTHNITVDIPHSKAVLMLGAKNTALLTAHTLEPSKTLM